MLLKDELACTWPMQGLPSKNKELSDEGYFKNEVLCLCGKIHITVTMLHGKGRYFRNRCIKNR